MNFMIRTSCVRTFVALFVSAALVGCGGGSGGTSGDAPKQSDAAQKANDAYVNQIAKDAMKSKTNEKPGAASAPKAGTGVAPR